MRRRGPGLLAVLAFGYAFLYAPIVTLIVFSFNDSKLVTVWSGFSTRWYGELLRNAKLLDAGLLSLKIAAVTATLAVVIGLAAAFALERFRDTRGRKALALMAYAPLVVPEVALGLSMLLLFVGLEGWIGWPAGRGAMTVTIAHVTFACAFVTVIVRARLRQLDPMLEDAAADLGARPAATLWSVTLPTLLPAVASGWLLAFTLSLDDLIVASFVSGPASSTLPMVVFSSVRLGLTPEINALATVFVAVVSVMVGGGAALMLREERRRRRALLQAAHR
ncbi:MAG: ABC transporter permease subunit [Alphaproteobacteria bacterium]